MKRRNFLMNAGAASALMLPGVSCTEKKPPVHKKAEETIAGMTWKQHREELWSRLFDEYLPFWDHGGYDEKYGGFICNLDKSGVPVDDQKFIWYQGRAVWVYSFLYNHIKKDPKYLEIARKTRDFMVEKMYAGDGKWVELVHRDGRVIKGIEPDSDIYGWLFAANGLAEYYRITGNEEDLSLAKESIWASVKAYDSPHYRQGTEEEGYRIQGHSMIFLRLLTQLLSYHTDSKLEELLNEHKDRIMNNFYYPELRISNETLHHDYSRIKETEDSTITGHSLETQWMIMDLALRRNDMELYEKARKNFKRYLLMAWDYNFDGYGSESYYVFRDYPLNEVFSIKTMWAHTEILNGCLLIYAHEQSEWAREWYDLTWNYVKDHFCLGTGAWEQAVDRRGRPQSREKWGIDPNRRGNFHQPRFLMMAIMRLNRMLGETGPATGGSGA